MAVLTSEQIPGIIRQVLQQREREQHRLTRIQKYYKGKHDSVYKPRGASTEYRKIAEQARVNFLPLIVSVIAQNLHVDGYRLSPPPPPKTIKVAIEPPDTSGTSGTSGTPPAPVPAAPAAPAPKPAPPPSAAGGVPSPATKAAAAAPKPATAKPATAAAVPQVPQVPAPRPLPKSVTIPTGLLFDDNIEETTSAPWRLFSQNKMISKQHALHRAIMKYGLAYTVVLPATITNGDSSDGDGSSEPGPKPSALIRPVSPRRMTAFYADEVDDEWPIFAVEVFPMNTLKGKKIVIRLYDDEDRYTLIIDDDRNNPRPITPDDGFMDGSTAVDHHGLGVCPVVRFLHEIDLDGETDVVGEIEPLIPLQDQVNSTTFNKMIAEAFASFRQRYVSGMEVNDAEGRAQQPFEPGVDRLWVAEDADTKFGEFAQTQLGDYLTGVDKTLQHASTIAQVPPYQLLGLVANLSAEALAAARDGLDRKIQELQASLTEPYKQTFRLAAHAAGDSASATDDGAYVVWRDTSARAFAATIDALGKMSQMLGVPAPELWNMIPGVNAEMVARWKTSLAQPGVLDELSDLINKAVTKGANPQNPGTPGATPYNQFEAKQGGV